MPQQTNAVITLGQSIAAVTALVIADFYFYYQVEFLGNLKIFKENNFLENTQAVLLAVAGISFAQVWLYAPKTLKLVPCAATLLCFSFILREIDVEKFNLPSWIVFLGYGIGRNVMLICLWLVVLYYFYRQRRKYWRVAMGLLKAGTGNLMVISGLLLILGSLFEDNVFAVQHYQFYEELCELNAYFLIVIASLRLYFDLQRTASWVELADSG